MKRFLILLLLVSGCAYSVRTDHREIGWASWYGEPFHGRKTSNGETYDMYGLTAAHRTLPFGTVLKVTDLTTGHSVEVRVNDRGPFIRGRILDLSYGAALKLGTVQRGVAEVEIKIIHMEKEDAPQRFLIQVGSFSVLDNAYRVKEYFEQYHRDVFIESVETNAGLFHRVRVGPFESSALAYRALRTLSRHEAALGPLNMVIVRGN